MSEITVYGVEDNHGEPVAAYDEPLSLEDARPIARRHHGRVIAYEYTYSDSHLVDGEDYTVTGGEWYSADDDPATDSGDQQRDLADGLYAAISPDDKAGNWTWEIVEGDPLEAVPLVEAGTAADETAARQAVHDWACENIDGWRKEQDI